MNDCRYWHTDLSPWSFGPADIKKACDVLGVDSDMGLTEKLFHSWSGNTPVPLLADPVSEFIWGRMDSIPSSF